MARRLPPTIVSLPEPEVTVRALGPYRQIEGLVLAIAEGRAAVVQHISPNGPSSGLHAKNRPSFFVGISEEISKQATEYMIGKEYDGVLVILKCGGELIVYLHEGVKELNKDVGSFICRHRVVHALPTAVRELMTEGAPVLLHQHR
jgi:hypothetical protein